VASILIIDDDPVFSDMAKQRLERASHEVSVHIGPFGATVAARKPGLDLILIDVFMPALQGPDLVELIRQRNPGLRPKIMFCSSMDEGPLRELALRHLVEGCVPKSADRTQFVTAVEHVLERRPARNAL